MYLPGQNFSVSFTTQTPDGELADADELPTGVLRRNLVNDATPVITVTRLAEGDYVASGTIPDDYAVGDTIELLVSAMVDGTDGKLFARLGVVAGSLPAVYAG